MSYVVSSVARCEAGCPEPGTTAAQDVHNLAAVGGYGAALLGLLLFGASLRRVPAWRPVAVATLVLFPLLVAASSAAGSAETPDRGLWPDL